MTFKSILLIFYIIFYHIYDIYGINKYQIQYVYVTRYVNRDIDSLWIQR